MKGAASLRILLVEDQAELAASIIDFLEGEGHRLDYAADGRQGLDLALASTYDVVLLDLRLPRLDGLGVCRELRATAERHLPILMLTARDTLDDKIAGFDAGADDYMTKPVAIRELSARIKALLRRSRAFREEEVLEQGPIRLDMASHQLYVEGDPVHLGQTEYKLLQFFLSHPGRVYSRAQLLDFVWGRNVYVEERTVDVHILRLRKALKPSGMDGVIQTVRGAGYRFTEAATQ